MPPAAMTAHGNQPKHVARKSILPAIPRVLEKSRSRKSSEVATPSTASESKDAVVSDRALGSDDWASVVAQDQELESTKTEHVTAAAEAGSAPMQISKVNGNNDPGQLKSSSTEEDKKQSIRAQNKGWNVNGVANTFDGTSIIPPRRSEGGIVFGGSLVSSESSPVIASAYTTNVPEPVPRSESASTPSQSSQPVYVGAQSAVVSGPFITNKLQPSPTTNLDHPPIITPQHRVDQRFMQPVRGPNMAQDPMNVAACATQVDPLRSYLLTQFNNREFADCTMDIRIGGHIAHINLHSVVIARSPKIRSLLAPDNCFVGQDGKKQLILEPTDAYVSILALVSALRVCYGASASATHFVASFPVPPLADERGYVSMDMCLSYLAAGHLLQLSEVATIGLESACHMINLENLETFFGFGLSGSLESFESPPSDVMSPTSIGRGKYHPYSDSIVAAGLHFLIPKLYGSFTLDPSAAPSEKLGGIPNFQGVADIGHRRVSSNPRLSLIQFGDLVSSTDPQSGSLSTILLSLPFEILRHVLMQVARLELTQAVVAERERRRMEYVQRYEAQDNGIYGRVHKKSRASWKESVDHSNFGVHRRWAGN